MLCFRLTLFTLNTKMKQKLKIGVNVGVFLSNKTEVLICVTTFWIINVYEKNKVGIGTFKLFNHRNNLNI